MREDDVTHQGRPARLVVEDFWVDKTVVELLQEQGVAPVHDPQRLAMTGVSDDEWAAFFETLTER